MHKMAKSLKEKCASKIHEWGSLTTSHGIPNMFRTKNNIIRVMWLAFLLASVTYCTYTIIKSIIEYSKYETTVSIKRTQQLAQTFPAVTICNLNPYNYDFAESRRKEIIISSLYNSSCLDLYRQYLAAQCDLKELERLVVEYEIDSNSSFCQNLSINIKECNQEYRTYIPYQYKHQIANLINEKLIAKEDVGRNLTLQNCNYNGIPCNEMNFTKFWTNRFGYCYSFNDGQTNRELFRTRDKGSMAGLELELFIKSSHYDDSERYSGLYLVVHNQSSLAFTLNNGITLPTGNRIYVGVNRVFNQKLSSPYSDCIDELRLDDPYARRLFDFFKEFNISYYDQEVCLNICYQDKLIDKCNCSTIKFSAIRNTIYCYTNRDILCLESFNAEYLNSDDLNSVCGNACPEKCNTIEYQLVNSYSTYPTDAFVTGIEAVMPGRIPSILVRQTDITDGRQFLMNIVVNYENFYYTTITESPSITFESLLGIIGGQLGLFIGISFLSLIELFELAIELSQLYIQHRYNVAIAPAAATTIQKPF